MVELLLSSPSLSPRDFSEQFLSTMFPGSAHLTGLGRALSCQHSLCSFWTAWPLSIAPGWFQLVPQGGGSVLETAGLDWGRSSPCRRESGCNSGMTSRASGLWWRTAWNQCGPAPPQGSERSWDVSEVLFSCLQFLIHQPELVTVCAFGRHWELSSFFKRILE